VETEDPASLSHYPNLISKTPKRITALFTSLFLSRFRSGRPSRLDHFAKKDDNNR